MNWTLTSRWRASAIAQTFVSRSVTVTRTPGSSSRARSTSAFARGMSAETVSWNAGTSHAFVSRRDFNAWGGFLMVGLWVLIGTMLLNFFFQNPAIDLWLASVSVLLFSGLLVFDTWRLRNFYGPDEYVGAAVQIYLDLLNMFMAILRIMGNRRN